MKSNLSILLYLLASFFVLSCEKRHVHEVEKQSGAGLAMDHFALMRMYPNGEFPNRNYTSAFEQKKKANFSRGNDLADWQSMGPKNIGGRALCFDFYPDHPDTIFLGSASGGLWKTTTAGIGRTAWEQVPIGFPVSGIGAIAIDPTDGDVMYIGTGEVYNADASAPGVVNRLTRGIPGIGILKSEDGGRSWTKSLDWAYKDRTGIQDLVINPQNTNTIFAATTDGLYRTRDAGLNWTKLDTLKMAVDIEIHPQDTNYIFVTYGNLNSVHKGLYRSRDGGNSFQLLDNGIPNNYTGKAHISISESNPNVIYASVANIFQSIGLFKSVNGGDSWSNVNTLDVARYQGWYSHDVVVNPRNENQVIYVGIDAHRSLNGGNDISVKSNWFTYYSGKIPVGGAEGPSDYVHSDIHLARYHPTRSGVIYLATDGGFFESLNNGDTWRGRNGGLQTQQFYANFSNSTSDSLFAIGGMQDNQTAIYEGDDAWIKVLDGDGMSTAINTHDDNIVYGSSQWLYMHRSTNRGNSFTEIFRPPLGEQAIFSAPFELGIANPSVMYTGASSLFISTNRGSNWTATAHGIVDDSTSIQNIAVGARNPALVYLSTAPYDLNSTARPKLFKTVNGGITITELTGLPNRFMPDIAIHPTNDSIVYVVCSGFGTSHVYKTIDGGMNWQAMDNGLPDIPTNTIVIDPFFPDFIYVGNDAGVWFSANGGLNWEPFVAGLPEAAIAFHLSISPANRKLRIATHGNGAYQSPLVEPGILNLEEGPGRQIAYLGQNFPNPASQQTAISFNLECMAQIRLSLYDMNGRLVKTFFEGPKRQGSHTILIDVSSLPPASYLYELSGEVKDDRHMFSLRKVMIKGF